MLGFFLRKWNRLWLSQRICFPLCLFPVKLKQNWCQNKSWDNKRKEVKQEYQTEHIWKAWNLCKERKRMAKDWNNQYLSIIIVPSFMKQIYYDLVICSKKSGSWKTSGETKQQHLSIVIFALCVILKLPRLVLFSSTPLGQHSVSITACLQLHMYPSTQGYFTVLQVRKCNKCTDHSIKILEKLRLGVAALITNQDNSQSFAQVPST